MPPSSTTLVPDATLPKPARDLAPRVLTAVVCLPLLAGAIFGPAWLTTAVFTFGAAAAAWELIGLLVRPGEAVGTSGRVWRGVGAGVTAAACALIGAGVDAAWLAALAGLGAVGLAALSLSVGPGSATLPERAMAALTSLAWVGLPLGALCLLRAEAGEQGPGWIVLALAVTWFGDAGAYFVGRSLGRRKLAPLLSPNKTVEGAIGGALVATGLAALVGWLMIPDLQPWQAALIGLGANILGQLGDLVESGVKRRAGAKDSGRLIVGYGGMLDKIDSLLFAAPWLLAAWLLT